MKWKTRRTLVPMGERTLVMGVLNVTPDSFSDGGKFLDVDSALRQGCLMAAQGADILDVGGESTRPGSEPVSVDEELARVVPVIRALRKALPDILLSVDSSKGLVAEAALAAGADILNDVTACRSSPEIFDLAANSGAGLVLMHMQGLPQSMQRAPQYEDILIEVNAFFQERILCAQAAGVDVSQIVLDPGIGFGKTLIHNLELIAGLGFFLPLGCPLLLGVSRKRWLGELTGRDVDDRLAASLGGAAACMSRGANILRVHDVIESCDLVKIIDKVNQTRPAALND
jgi:dihydropteroate synthase